MSHDHDDATEPTRFTSLADLGRFYGLDPDAPPDEAEQESPSPAETTDNAPADEPGAAIPDAAALFAALLAAATHDNEQRTADLAAYAHYETLVATQQTVAAAHEQAVQRRTQAEEILAQAWTDALRLTATRTLAQLRRDEARQAEELARCRVAVDAAGAGLDLARLRAERQRQQQAAQQQAAASIRARRLAETLAAARAALAADSLEEATRLVGIVATEGPHNAEVAALQSIIEQRCYTRKVTTAEQTLWTARRELRRNPALAVSLLTALDLTDLPETLGRQLFGCWAHACRRLCLQQGIDEPLRYAPDPGRGAILVPDPTSGDYNVFSAIGMGPQWQPGLTVDPRQARRARPLVARA